MKTQTTPTHGEAYYHLIRERFSRDIAGHEITIEGNDNAPHRSILALNPKEDWSWFRVVTYPGGLLFTGDMGSFVFERCEDMFRWWPQLTDNGLTSFSYIAEKCQAVDRRSGITEYSSDLAEETVANLVSAHLDSFSSRERESISGDYLERMLSAKRDLGAMEYSSGEWCVQEFYRILCVAGLEDYCETSAPTEYTLRFLWCCFAVRWLIDQYREQTEGLGGFSDVLVPAGATL